VRVFNREGKPLWGEAGHAVAWSADERFAAVAGAREIAIVPAVGGKPVARIPAAARDVDWRAPR
jgi:hypothetical protein